MLPRSPGSAGQVEDAERADLVPGRQRAPGIGDVPVAGQVREQLPEGLPAPFASRAGEILAEPVDVGGGVLREDDALGPGKHQQRRIEIGARPDVQGLPDPGGVTAGLNQEFAGALDDFGVLRQNRGVVDLPVLIGVEI